MLPVPKSGDYARDYNFYFSLYVNPLAQFSLSQLPSENFDLYTLASIGKSALKTLMKYADAGTLEYVSSLARKSSIPDHEIEMDSINLGSVQIEVPSRIKTNSFTVDYLDDEENTVYNFHIGWQSTVKSQLSFELLSLCSLGCVMGSLDRTPGKTERPTSVQQYPQIFPKKISVPDYDKGGDSLRSITVEYVRIPRVHIIQGDKLSEAFSTATTITKYLNL